MAAERRRAAHRRGLVARVRARALRRRARRDFRAELEPRAPFVQRRPDGQSRWCDDVRTRTRRDLRELLFRVARQGAARTCAGASARSELAMGRGARRAAPPPAVHARAPGWRGSSTSACRARATPTRERRRSDFNDDAEPFANRHAAELPRDLATSPTRRRRCSSIPAASRATRSRRTTAASPSAWARGEYVPMVTDRRSSRPTAFSAWC